MPDFYQLRRATEIILCGGALGRLLRFHLNCVPLQHRPVVTVHCEGELVH